MTCSNYTLQGAVCVEAKVPDKSSRTQSVSIERNLKEQKTENKAQKVTKQKERKKAAILLIKEHIQPIFGIPLANNEVTAEKKMSKYNWHLILSDASPDPFKNYHGTPTSMYWRWIKYPKPNTTGHVDPALNIRFGDHRKNGGHTHTKGMKRFARM